MRKFFAFMLLFNFTLANAQVIFNDTVINAALEAKARELEEHYSYTLEFSDLEIRIKQTENHNFQVTLNTKNRRAIIRLGKIEDHQELRGKLYELESLIFYQLRDWNEEKIRERQFNKNRSRYAISALSASGTRDMGPSFSVHVSKSMETTIWVELPPIAEQDGSFFDIVEIRARWGRLKVSGKNTVLDDKSLKQLGFEMKVFTISYDSDAGMGSMVLELGQIDFALFKNQNETSKDILNNYKLIDLSILATNDIAQNIAFFYGAGASAGFSLQKINPEDLKFYLRGALESVVGLIFQDKLLLSLGSDLLIQGLNLEHTFRLQLHYYLSPKLSFYAEGGYVHNHEKILDIETGRRKGAYFQIGFSVLAK